MICRDRFFLINFYTSLAIYEERVDSKEREKEFRNHLYNALEEWVTKQKKRRFQLLKTHLFITISIEIIFFIKNNWNQK